MEHYFFIVTVHGKNGAFVDRFGFGRKASNVEDYFKLLNAELAYRGISENTHDIRIN